MDQGSYLEVVDRIYDLTGHLLEKPEHWEHVKIPMIAPAPKVYSFNKFCCE